MAVEVHQKGGLVLTLSPGALGSSVVCPLSSPTHSLLCGLSTGSYKLEKKTRLWNFSALVVHSRVITTSLRTDLPRMKPEISCHRLVCSEIFPLVSSPQLVLGVGEQGGNRCASVCKETGGSGQHWVVVPGKMRPGAWPWVERSMIGGVYPP